MILRRIIYGIMMLKVEDHKCVISMEIRCYIEWWDKLVLSFNTISLISGTPSRPRQCSMMRVMWELTGVVGITSFIATGRLTGH